MPESQTSKEKIFFDSHAHLTCDSLLPLLDPLLERAKKERVGGIINICTDKKSLEKGLELADQENWVFNAGATTPHDVKEEGERMFATFEVMARTGKLIAIGETGLDYHYEHSPRKIQQTFLRNYLALSLELHMPVLLHCRDAFDDLYHILSKEFGALKKVVMHCFTGTMKEAEKALEKGWYLSLSGILTFTKSKELHQLAQEIPLSQLLIETDAPYLAPESRRGQVNEPSYIIETAQKVADLKKISLEEVALATWENTLRVFSLKGVFNKDRY
ncbi:MAG: TatD family hydrolase [Simkania negevensis]|nr:TatD family hydrolase [Simkania negevensis]